MQAELHTIIAQQREALEARRVADALGALRTPSPADANAAVAEIELAYEVAGRASLRMH